MDAVLTKILRADILLQGQARIVIIFAESRGPVYK